MENVFETITAMPTITVFCLLAAQFVKLFTPLDNKHLPVFCGVAGLILGVACYLFFPGILPAQNVIVAAKIGVINGWAATGANQVVKQYAGSNG